MKNFGIFVGIILYAIILIFVIYSLMKNFRPMGEKEYITQEQYCIKHYGGTSQMYIPGKCIKYFK